MDRTYIESQHIVERYLSGDLTVREAREFEKHCLEHPELLNSLPIPVRVKAKMVRKPGDELSADDFDPTATNTSIDAAGLDEDDDEGPTARGFRGSSGGSGRWSFALGVALAVVAVGAGVLYFRVNSLEKQLKIAQRAGKSLQLHAPGGVQEFRVKPSYTQPTAPTVNVGWPNPPQLIDLHVNLSEGKYSLFLVTIDSVTDGRAIQIRRVARDSNGELRIGLNSSAFGQGEYDVKFEGYTMRGDTVPVGWVRLGLK